MKIRLAAVVFLFLLVQGGATAEETEPCSGVACVLDPIYKVGRSIFASAKEEVAPLPPPQAKSEEPATESPRQNSAQSGDGAGSKETTPAAEESADGPRAPRKSKVASRPRSKTQTVGRTARSTYDKPIAAVRPRESVAPGVATPSVAVAANEPELGRMLALASVVRSPTIRVVRASAGPCERKPAFVVDLLQNLSRLGPAIPLFSESLIILARDGSSSIEQLRGKPVSFGLPGSNSEQIGKRLFSSLKIDVRETPLDIDNSLDALSLGGIDAVALLVPSGYDRLARLDPKLRLISLGDGVVPPDGLKITRIEPNTYLGGSWPSRKIGVITVDAVLSPNQDSPRDVAATSVYAALDRNATALARSGFDLIGGDTLVTMRSVAKDVAPPPKLEAPHYPAFAQDGC